MTLNSEINKNGKSFILLKEKINMYYETSHMSLDSPPTLCCENLRRNSFKSSVSVEQSLNQETQVQIQENIRNSLGWLGFFSCKLVLLNILISGNIQ